MYALRLLIILLITNSLYAQKKVFVVSIKDQIDFSMTRSVSQSLQEATEKGSDYILVDMNTYGGLLDEADKIKTLMLNYPKPVWVFVNDNAASAGALISLACDSIYMANGASIGAATVVNEDGVAFPDKVQSYMRSKMRNLAQASHRDTNMAQAMVDPNIILKDSSLKKKGQVLTLTTSEALKYGFCEKQVNNYEEIFAHNHIGKAVVLTYQRGTADVMFDILMNEWVTGILIFIILIAFFVELGSPSGIPSILIILLGVLFFLPRYYAGLIENWEILLLSVGVVLLMLEVFVIPGFGIVGIVGIISILGSLCLMMLNNHYFDFEHVSTSMISSVAVIMFACVVIIVVAFFLVSSKILNNRFFRKIALTQTMTTTTELNQIDNSIVSHTHLIHHTALTHTDLRPSGKVDIEGEIYDAVTKGDFIAKGKTVVIVAVFNNSLVVKEKV